MTAQPTIDDALAAAAPILLHHMNETYQDSMSFLGRILGGRPDATSCRAVAVDAKGIELVVVDPSGEHAARVEFDEPLTDVVQVGARTFELVASARTRSGEPGETTAEREYRLLRAIRTFLTSVSAVEDVHPHLRRITFAGGDLTGFAPLGPDTFLYVLLPPSGSRELTIDQTFTWERCGEMAEADRPVGAYYTLRDWRAETAELDMVFVLHEPAGPASAWAARAVVGDPVALWGPREAFEPPAGTQRYVLVADDTGLPAVARIIETLPEGTPVLVVGEVDGPDERQDLPHVDGVHVTWVHRDGRPAGTAPELLLDAVRRLGLRADPADGTGGITYVWGGGESRAMTAVRRYLRHEVGFPRNQVSLMAYWRHSDSPDGYDDHDDHDDQDDGWIWNG